MQENLKQARAYQRLVSIAVGAAMGIAAAEPMAAIVDSGAINIVVPQTIDGIYLNWVTNAQGLTGLDVPGWDIDLWASGTSLNPPAPRLGFYTSAASNNSVVGVGNTASALPIGTVVGPGSNFATTGAMNTNGTAFQTTTTAYVGIRFLNEGTGALNYGYAEIQTTAPLGFPATVKRYRYENTGAAITVAGGGPAVQSRKSRKDQGGAGTFDLTLIP